MIMALRTEHSIARAKKRDKVYSDYRALAAKPENMKSAIIQHLMAKYDISYSTVYSIIKEKEAHQ